VRKLMTVISTFFNRDKGFLELQPMFSAMGELERWVGWRTLPADVPRESVAEIRRPDGSKFEATYRIISEHFIWENRLENPAWAHSVMLKHCEELDVPPGSEIWLDVSDRA